MGKGYETIKNTIAWRALSTLGAAFGRRAVSGKITLESAKMLDFRDRGTRMEIITSDPYRIEWAGSQEIVTASWQSAHFNFRRNGSLAKLGISARGSDAAQTPQLGDRPILIFVGRVPSQSSGFRRAAQTPRRRLN